MLYLKKKWRTTSSRKLDSMNTIRRQVMNKKQVFEVSVVTTSAFSALVISKGTVATSMDELIHRHKQVKNAGECAPYRRH